MLLEFRAKNYKSFREEAVFSMAAAPKQKGLDYSLLHVGAKDNSGLKAICSSVIYGPNAAGKTNIISAMDTMRSIVLRGNIRNTEEITTPNIAAAHLELIPNNCIKNQPVDMAVEFFEDKFRIKYELSLDLGSFLDDEYERKVCSEKLTIDGKLVFERTDLNLIVYTKPIKKYLVGAGTQTETMQEAFLSLAIGTLDEQELFLTNGFKTIYSPKITSHILDWFTNKFMVIYRADSINVIRRFSS